MYVQEKQKPDMSFFDVEKVREKNNKALKKLQKFNAELENASDRRSRYQNRKKLEKHEKEFFRDCEKRLHKLNLESDIWADEEHKLDSLCKRRAMLSEVLATTNEQLIEEAVMKSLNKGAQQQQDRLEVVNKELRKNIGVASRLYIEQASLFELFTDKERENTRMVMVQDNCFKEIRQKLKMCNLVTIKKKVNPADELVNKAIIKNQKLENKLRSLCQQAVTVPMLKYRYICAADEERRLNTLNEELETVVLVLTERLSDHTGWDVAFQDMEKKVKVQQQAMNDRLRKIEELKAKTKLGTKSMFLSFSKEKMERDRVSRHLDCFRSKVSDLQREYRSFQPEIEAFLIDLQYSSDAVIPESPLIKAENVHKNVVEESSTESSPYHDSSDSEETSDINGFSQKPAAPFVNVSYHSKDSPESKVKEPPRSSIRKETPSSSIRKETPHSSSRKETPHSSSRKETPHSSSRKETPHSSSRKETPHSSSRKETPRSTMPVEDSSESDSQPRNKTYFTERLRAGCKTAPAKRSEEQHRVAPSATRPETTSAPDSDSWWDYLF